MTARVPEIRQKHMQTVLCWKISILQSQQIYHKTESKTISTAISHLDTNSVSSASLVAGLKLPMNSVVQGRTPLLAARAARALARLDRLHNRAA